ncbi:MAG: MTAP family purine nucleoside phosphorylase [Vulcanimicrobiota bacterium]
MPEVALIGGTIYLNSEVLAGAKRIDIKTEFGMASLMQNDKAVFLPRHGLEKNIPPHMINHRANITALKECGVTKIVGATSTGSLHRTILPGTLMIPDDYVNLWSGSDDTLFDHSLVNITPMLDDDMRQIIVQACKRLSIQVIDKGVYLQTKGPRLETKAEIRFLQNFADIIGMTMGSEASVAQEAGLKYAGIASVDNYAHGLIETPLSADEIRINAGKMADLISNIFFEVLRIVDSSKEVDNLR